jgi:hypothetical protein
MEEAQDLTLQEFDDAMTVNFESCVEINIEI